MSKHDKESYDYLTWLAEDHKKRSKLDKAPKQPSLDSYSEPWPDKKPRTRIDKSPSKPKYVRPVHEIDIEDEYVDEHDIYKD